MKKKILIIASSLHIGGITISLDSLLSAIDTSKYEIDVFASHSGYYFGKLPNCRMLCENIWLSYPMKTHNILFYLQKVIYGFRYILSKLHIEILPLIYRIGGYSIKSKKYDAVICYDEGLASKVSFFPSNNRIAWIHCDYSRHLLGNNIDKERRAYNNYNHIVCVSEYAKSVFCNIFPEDKENVVAIHNIININQIIEKAHSIEALDPRFDDSQFTIVSIGRIDPVKQFHLIPYIAKQVRESTNRFFKWYIIGGTGVHFEILNQLKEGICKYGLSDIVILLGEKNNVYPYLLKSKALVNTSKSEAYSLVNNEAKALGITVITNDFPSAKETITNGIDGYIIPVNSIANVIVRLMDKPLQTEKTIINNTKSLYSIYKLI